MIIEDWGLIDYSQALKKQTEYLEMVAADHQHPGFLIFCSHPAVVTTGRQTKADDIFAWTGPVIEVSRGGRATYHGPSQVVVYPIINLKNSRSGRGPQEIRGFIRSLEECIVQTLGEYGLKRETNKDSSLEDTGVWISEKKIASIGIAVRKWISFHGAAINVLADSSAFQGLNPCGYQSSVMTCLEDCLKEKIDLNSFKQKLKIHCLNLL